MATAGYVVLATASNNVFSGAKKNDLLVYSGGSGQNIYMGQSNSTSYIHVSSNLVKVIGNLDFSGALTQNGAAYSSGTGGGGSFGGTSAAISGQIACGSLQISANVISSDPVTAATAAVSASVSVYTGTASAFTGIGSNADSVSKGAMSMELASSNAYLNFVSWNPAGTSNSEVLRITGDGYMGIGTVAPAYPLDVSGTIRSTTMLYTSLQQSSDARIKENVSAIDPVWATTVIEKLSVVNYNFIGANEPTVGFIAQEVESVIPIATKTATGFIPCLVDVTVAEGGLSFTVENTVDHVFDVFAVGDTIKVTGSNSGVQLTTIESIVDGVFTIGPAIVGSSFEQIVGRSTNDFKTIDYNALVSCSIAAIQALTERVAALEAALLLKGV